MPASADAIRDLVEAALTSSGLELWDVEISRDTVRVLVDRPGGIDLDSLTSTASVVVAPLLDDHPELTPEGSFQLEVSSPGVERTLRRADQYSRYVGSEITVKTSVPVSGGRRHHGTLLSVGDRAIELAPKDAPPGTVVELAYAAIERARTVLVWGPAPKPGAGARAGGKKVDAPVGAKTGGSPKRTGSKQDRAIKRPVATGLGEVVKPVASIEPKGATS